MPVERALSASPSFEVLQAPAACTARACYLCRAALQRTCLDSGNISLAVWNQPTTRSVHAVQDKHACSLSVSAARLGTVCLITQADLLMSC